MLPSLDSARRSKSLTELNVSSYPATLIGGDWNRQRREELTSRRLKLFKFYARWRDLVYESSLALRFVFLFPWRFRFTLFLTCGRQPPWSFAYVNFTCGRQPPWSFLCIVFSSVCGGRKPPYSVCSCRYCDNCENVNRQMVAENPCNITASNKIASRTIDY